MHRVLLFIALLGGFLAAPQPAWAQTQATLDQTARFIAGLPQLQAESPYTVHQRSEQWQKHSRSIAAHWERFSRIRLAKMEDWSADELQSAYDPSLTMLYPFSGPDFVSAHAFYPAAPRYIFFALEEIRPLPSLLELAPEAAYRTLRAVDRSLRDIYSKGYFITTHMSQDLEAPEEAALEATGVVPVFMVFMARTGHELLEAQRVMVTPGGELVPLAAAAPTQVNAIRFRFRDRDTARIQELIYFSVNQHDEVLAEHPDYVRFLRSMGPTNTFMKAASYLLFGRTGEGFITTRKIILERSQTLFQDDSGMPLKYLGPESWDRQLYGKYTPPISDFGASCYQEDLEALYEETPRSQIKRLPFAMGYHIVGDKVQNHMFLTRKAPR